MASSSSCSDDSWSQLPQDILVLFVARLPFPGDRARFRAVCRCWRSAVRHHVPPSSSSSSFSPWVLRPDGYFFTPSDDGTWHRLPANSFFPDDGGTVGGGSTDAWIALLRRNSADCCFLLQNPFSGATVRLPELDAVLGGDSTTDVRKVVVRDDDGEQEELLVTVMTDNGNHPLVLCRPGARHYWSPEPWEVPYLYIVDVAFLGDGKLYAITKAEDLVSLDLAYSDGGSPVVVNGACLIRQPLGYDDYDAWTDDDAVEPPHHDHEEAQVVVVAEQLEVDDDDHDEQQHAEEPVTDDDDDDDDVTREGLDYAYDELGDLIITVRYLVAEPRSEKLFVLLLKLHPEGRGLEADVGAGSWLPVTSAARLGGQTLFISKRFSKFAPSDGSGDQVQDGCVYFVDTGEVFDVGSQTVSLTRYSFAAAVPVPLSAAGQFQHRIGAHPAATSSLLAIKVFGDLPRPWIRTTKRCSPRFLTRKSPLPMMLPPAANRNINSSSRRFLSSSPKM
ncbi:hypothetical protein BRADI_1g16652v3 [Brachypodium distachyon]|uniref:F-box domain-containing protein n=1 Tax=Brachypodium distachyon TaxID=15368 RepID=A0A0Q3NC44_BRADI|nr:hypothetical protein BRADI_1g16652v3 [Brachypodium distachyon]